MPAAQRLPEGKALLADLIIPYVDMMLAELEAKSPGSVYRLDVGITRDPLRRPHDTSGHNGFGTRHYFEKALADSKGGYGEDDLGWNVLRYAWPQRERERETD